MNDISHNPKPERNSIDTSRIDLSLDAQVEAVIGRLDQIAKDTMFDAKTGIFWRAVEPKVIFPFLPDTGERIVPVSTEAMQKLVTSNYQRPPQELVDTYKEFSSKPENYGTAPGESLAFLETLIGLFQPRHAFVFGTGTGNMERIIAKNSLKTQIVTLDIRTEQLGNVIGAPDENNIRYRKGLGIETDDDIGKNFKNEPELSDRIHQLFGNSFAFNPGRLAGSMQFVVVGGGHSLPVALNDLKNALLLIDRSEGGIIFVDDVRKKATFNSGVDGAVVNFSNITGLPVLMPQPAPGKDDFAADVGMIIVPQNFQGLDECIEELNTLIELFAKRMNR